MNEWLTEFLRQLAWEFRPIQVAEFVAPMLAFFGIVGVLALGMGLCAVVGTWCTRRPKE